MSIYKSEGGIPVSVSGGNYAVLADGKTISNVSDVLRANYIGENIADNSDFGINQRGIAIYNTVGYTADCWLLNKISTAPTVGTVAIASNTATITSAGVIDSARLIQKFERAIPAGTHITIAVHVTAITGDWRLKQVGGDGAADITSTGWSYVSVIWTYQYGTSQNAIILYNTTADGSITIDAVKVEYGDAFTGYNPPNPATELARCQRYYQIRSTNDISTIDLRPSMRSGVTPTVMAVSGGYAYSTEL